MAGYDEQLVRRLIVKIMVYEDRFEMEFKSGMAVNGGKVNYGEGILWYGNTPQGVFKFLRITG